MESASIITQTKNFSISDNYFSVSNIGDDFELIQKSDSNPDFNNSQYIESIAAKFLEKLYSEVEVSVDSIGQIINYVNSDYSSNPNKNSVVSNLNFSKIFIDLIIGSRKSLTLLFKNFNNLKHFSNILNTISINIDNVNSENYDLNFAIIYIAGRSFFRDESVESTDSKRFDKYYLSALLSQNKLYHTKSFWTDLIELKIARKVEESMTKRQSLKKKVDTGAALTSQIGLSSVPFSTTTKDYNTNFNYSMYSTNTTSSGSNNSIIGSMGSKLKGLFKGNRQSTKHKESRDLSNASMYNPNRMLDYTKNRVDTAELDSVGYIEASAVLREFIFHFANFSLDITDGMNIIVEIASKYNFPKERISLYVTLLNSNSFTIKNKLPQAFKPKRTKEDYLNSRTGIYALSSYERKLEFIISAGKYFQLDSIINLFTLNKECSKVVMNKTLSYILKSLKPTDSEYRIKIWKCLLNTVL